MNEKTFRNRCSGSSLILKVKRKRIEAAADSLLVVQGDEFKPSLSNAFSTLLAPNVQPKPKRLILHRIHTFCNPSGGCSSEEKQLSENITRTDSNKILSVDDEAVNIVKKLRKEQLSSRAGGAYGSVINLSIPGSI